MGVDHPSWGRERKRGPPEDLAIRGERLFKLLLRTFPGKVFYPVVPVHMVETVNTRLVALVYNLTEKGDASPRYFRTRQEETVHQGPDAVGIYHAYAARLFE